MWIAATAGFILGWGAGGGDKPAWVDLSGERQLGLWRSPTGNWFEAGDVMLDPRDPHYLIALPGKGVLVNGWNGDTNNLRTKQVFSDVEVHAEFMISKKSNSGIKLEGLYEIQIFDSWGVENPKASDCGGIYPRAELLPRYHYLDQGRPPRLNAARRPGEWQTLDIVFQAPRFGGHGKKAENARFRKVALNGILIHENVEVQTPTGHAWHDKEIPSGPLLLQADHGPVAFRNIRVRPLPMIERTVR
jgi:3-keto-disaccharide hydrolase